jgi:hypothetical protein
MRHYGYTLNHVVWSALAGAFIGAVLMLAFGLWLLSLGFAQ